MQIDSSVQLYYSVIFYTSTKTSANILHLAVYIHIEYYALCNGRDRCHNYRCTAFPCI